MAYKLTRRTGTSLRFSDIEQPNAPPYEIFREDEITGLPKNISREEQQLKKEAEAAEKKHKAKPQTAKRTGGKTNPRQDRGMTLKNADNKGSETEVSSSDVWLRASKNTAPSSKPQDKKTTSPSQPALSAELTRNFTRNRRATLIISIGESDPNQCHEFAPQFLHCVTRATDHQFEPKHWQRRQHRYKKTYSGYTVRTSFPGTFRLLKIPRNNQTQKKG